jgi:type IV pilus assembly protein PilA
MRDEEGFTLIELLVVMGIIGILAGIAISQFAAYRDDSFCARVVSDVKNTVAAAEYQYTEAENYNGITPVQSDGVTVTVNAAGQTLTSVAGTHADCSQGTYTFTGANGTYGWQ